jgi:hypothetical protein
MPEFSRVVADLRAAVEKASMAGVTLNAPSSASIIDFKARQREQLKVAVITHLQQVNVISKQLADPKVTKLVIKMNDTQDLDKLGLLVDELLDIATGDEQAARPVIGKKPRLPSEIDGDVSADLDEVRRCMDAKCFRSAVILCGRIMETVLHRKYYEVTQNDLLEKSPGIGLGNLIAKLSEHAVKLDPALNNQIHLINQVRIHSVHQKQDAFKPSEAQAKAIVLYTTDILEKLFS